MKIISIILKNQYAIYKKTHKISVRTKPISRFRKTVAVYSTNQIKSMNFLCEMLSY